MNKHSQNDFKTYVVGGKGFYTLNEAGAAKDVFNVPANCTIVLTTINESDITDDKPLLHHYMEYYQKLFQKDLDTLKNPQSFKDELGNPQSFKDELGETTTFETNDQCPDIHETLLLYDDGKCITNINGIIDTSTIYPDVGLPELYASIHDLTSDECKSVDFLKNLYSNSISPYFNSILLEYIYKFDITMLLKEWEKAITIANNLYNILKTVNLSGIIYCFAVKKPIKTYLIAAHGGQSKKMFQVPKGSTMVILEESGKLMSLKELQKYIKRLRTLDNNILQDPVKNKQLIEDTIEHSIVLYKEDTRCPLFYYDLLACNDSSKCSINSSGVIDIELLKKDTDDVDFFKIDAPGKKDTTILSNSGKESLKVISSFFRNSIYPRPSEITLFYNHIPHKNVYDSCYFNPLLQHISQEMLCLMYPGVYYNGVCRVTSSRIVNNATHTRNTTIRHSGIATQSNTTVYNTNKSLIEHVRKLGIPRPIIPQQIHHAIAASKQKIRNASMVTTIPSTTTNAMLLSQTNHKINNRNSRETLHIPPSKPIILPNKHTNAPNDLPKNRALPNNARLALIRRLEEGLDRARSQHEKYNYKRSLGKIITEIDNELQSMSEKHIEYQKSYNIEKEKRNKLEDIVCNAKARLSAQSINSLDPTRIDEQDISNARNKIAHLTEREIDGWIPYFKTYDATIQNLRKKRDELIIQQQKFNEQRVNNITRISSMKKGGGPLPLRYFDPNAYQSSASAGSDVLGVSGLEVRPKIGGRRATKRTKRVTKRTRTTRRMKGGFIPSIMEPFIFGCSKYIAPLAALSGWKLINMPTNRKTKRVTRK